MVQNYSLRRSRGIRGDGQRSQSTSEKVSPFFSSRSLRKLPLQKQLRDQEIVLHEEKNRNQSE